MPQMNMANLVIFVLPLFKNGSDPSIFISTFRESGIYLMYTPTMTYILDINIVSSYIVFSRNEISVLASFELINKGNLSSCGRHSIPVKQPVQPAVQPPPLIELSTIYL